MSYRVPPKPEYFDTVEPGFCRWCSLDTGFTPKGKRKISKWHAHCLEEYKFLFWPGTTKKEIYKRDKGICVICKTQTERKKWDLDHIIPLIESKGKPDLSFWQKGNLQTLCKPCHKLKTSAESTERARLRKLNKS